MECLNCKKDLTQTAGKRLKRFCNSTCRSNFWQKTKRLAKQIVSNYQPPISPTSEENAKKFNKAFKDEFEKQLPKPKNLAELKAICPFKEAGDNRTVWIATERQKYGI